MWRGVLLPSQAEPVELRTFELSLQEPCHPWAAAATPAIAGAASGGD
jgi:hypothetical protein